MSFSRSVTTPSPEVVTMKLGKHNVLRLRDLAMRESIKRMAEVTVNDLVKEALKNTYPAISFE